MSILFLIFSPLLSLTFAVVVTACFRFTARSAVALAVFMLAYAHVILTSRIASALYLLSDRAVWLLIQLVLVVLAGLIWWRLGKPRLPSFRPDFDRAAVMGSIRKHPTLWVLGAAVAVVYVIGIGLIVYVPPNNWDGMTYRLPRVAYWLQFDTFLPWNEPDGRLVSFPQNAEIGVLWTILLRGTDQFAGFVQWMAVLVGAVAIFGMARLLDFTRAQGLFSALIWMTLPQILLQSTTIQNDIVVSVFFVISVYFLYFAFKREQRSVLLLSGLALGLAIGTKSTMLIALPGLAVAALLLWLRRPAQHFRPLVQWGVYSLVGFVVFGAFTYVTNYLAYDHVLGTEHHIEGHIGGGESRIELLTKNAIHYTYQFLDHTGIPRRLAVPLIEVKSSVVGGPNFNVDERFLELHRHVFLPNEDRSWFGALGILLLPGIFYGAVIGAKNRDPYMLGLVIIAVSFFVVHSAMQEWTPFKGRYYNIPVTASAIFLAWPYKRVRDFAVIRWLSVVIAVGTMAMVTLYNQNKPLAGPAAVYNLDSIDRRTLGRTAIGPFLHAFEDHVPLDAVVAVQVYEWRYPYFGPEHTRYVIPFPWRDGPRSLEEIAGTQLSFPLGDPPAARSLPAADYIVVTHGYMNRVEDVTGFELLVDLSDLYLLARIDR